MHPVRAAVVAFGGLVMLATPAFAQRTEDSFKWYLGAQAGMLGFETPSQTRGFVPTAGGHILVMAKRTGLILSVDEAFGGSEGSGYTDATTPGGIRPVSFSHLRKYSAVITAFPVKGATQPYFGLGFGLLQVIDPQPGGVFTSQAQAGLAKQLASQKSTNGFIGFVTGVQFRLDQMVVFGQYHITSAPAAGQLVRSASHGLVGGLRVSLGGAKEGIHGGGY